MVLPVTPIALIAFRVLAAHNTPDFRTISDFRKDNVDALSGLFVQVLALCQQAGLVKLGHVALDGTKVKANASKHKAMSYQRMKEKAAQLTAEVAELLRQAQAADDEEDRRYGKDKRSSTSVFQSTPTASDLSPRSKSPPNFMNLTWMMLMLRLN